MSEASESPALRMSWFHVIIFQDCMYLHELGEEAASFTKEEMQQG